MKRLLIIVAAIVVVALIVWLAGGTTEPAEDPADEQPTSATPAAPAAPGSGFHVDLPVPEDSPASSHQPPQPTSIDVPPTAVAGVVVRAADETPLDAVVVVALVDDAQRGTVEAGRVTTKLGRFSFGADVTSRRPRYLAFTWTAPAPRKNPKAPAPRTVETRIVLAERSEPADQLRIALDTGWMVKGRVTNQGGKPLAGVAIEREGGVGAATDGAGEFLLRDIAPEERSVGLKFMLRGHRTATLAVGPPAGGGRVTDVVMTLEPAGAR